MSTAVKVTVAPERIALQPGGSADVEVTIQNASQVVEHFETSIVGLPSKELFSCEPEVVKLRPKEIGNVRVKISVPERGGQVAGPYVLGVLVRSPYQKEVSRCEELQMDVQPTPALSMNVQPELATGGKIGNYTVSLLNEGNTPLAVTLAGGDQENLVAFEIRPRELRLDPGMGTAAQVTASAVAPLTGQDKRRALTLRAHAGDVVVERQVSFVQKPKIAGGLMKVGGITAAIALLAGATIGGAMLIRDAKQDNQQPTNQANQSQVPPNNNNPPNQSQPQQTTQPQPTTQPNQSSGPPTPSTQTTGGQTPEGGTTVDFGKDAEESGEQPVAVNRYSQEGLLLSTDTQRATPNCVDAKAQSLRVSRELGLGGFLTSSKPTNSRACNSQPLQFVFTKPAKRVNLTFTGTLAVDYKITYQFTDGSTDERVAKVPAPAQAVTVAFDVPPGKQIKSVTFWHVNPDPAAAEFTIVKSIGFVPA